MDDHVLIKIINLTKKYKKTIALENVNLEIKRGECLVLLGPNGSGKSTLMRILAERLPYDSGQIEYHCQDVSYCPQENVFYEDLTVYENLEYFGAISGLKGNELKEKIEEVLELTGLEKLKDSYPPTLSGGTQRKLNIAIALINVKDLLILDEPTTGLDIISRQEIWDMINEVKKRNIGILLATHMIEEALALGDRICFIKKTVLDIGTFDELRKKYNIKSIIEVNTNKPVSKVPSGFVKKSDYVIEYPTLEPESELVNIVKKLLDDHIDVKSIKITYPKLEDLFVKIVGE